MNLDIPEWTIPAGLAVDCNGHLFYGLYNGSVVIEINPETKATVRTIKLPTPYIAAPSFGGPRLDVLFVATANLPIDFNSGERGTPLRQPPAGNLFMIRGLSAKGTPLYQPHIKSCC